MRPPTDTDPFPLGSVVAPTDLKPVPRQVLDRFLVLVREAVVEAAFVASAERWPEVQSDGPAGPLLLRSVSHLSGDDRSPATATWSVLLRQTNERAHAWRRTRGAASMTHIVAGHQGGHYCCLCGASESLQVDHVEPVSRGGDDRKLQLLCSSCNSAKKDGIAHAIRASLVEETSQAIRPAMRYLRLFLNAKRDEESRERGYCDCGARAGLSNRLRVSTVSHVAAANLLALVITCSECEDQS